jgi:hypothetical protein
MEGSFSNVRVYSDSLPKIVSVGGRHIFVEIVLLGNPLKMLLVSAASRYVT